MSKDLVDRVTDDLAAGQSVDWPAVIALAATPAERRQLESLRLIHVMSRQGGGSSQTVAVADTAPVGPPPPIGTRAATEPAWGRYLLVQEAGAGSFGTVYKAMDPVLQLDVAIKILHRHVDSAMLRERLLKEGRALARIRHQNVVRVLGVEFNGDRAGLCTEFIHGDTLETEVRGHGTFSQSQAVEVGLAVCQALTAVHGAGFVHRDVKARNVMRERDTGRIVLMDFGTGRELEQELASTELRMEGTAIYMAPEVLAGHRASHSSDVYSVGVLLYYILTGAYPVEGASIEDIRTAHLKGLRTRLGDRRSDLTPAFLRSVEKALAPKSSRYATPAALCEELEAVSAGRPLWARRLKAAATVAAVSAGTLLVLGFINTIYWNTALGRAAFVSEGIADWLKWGIKGTVAPIVIGAFLVMAATLVLECLHLLTRVSRVARRIEHVGAGLVHRWSLDDVKVLSSISLLSSAAVLFTAWWYFTPLLGTLTNILPDIATAPLEQLALLSPDLGRYHSLYRKTFIGTTLACVLLWYPTLRLAFRTKQRIPRRGIVGGSLVLAFSLILLDFPYRLLAHDIDFDEVIWDGRSCHVLGARADERLIFCPTLPVPRSRVVRADVLTPQHSAPLEWWEAGSIDAKRKKSIFKFLLTPAPAPRDGAVR